ncbi:hydrogenase nickel incorporation protein HypB [Alteromonas sp. CYL-A6]|uniref:hydrogenase nickel incorporation protein HypB n=1 Tax=Alteromonas nitratireducens TaxID=3390813 RepID=UPI0034AF642F
MCTHCGCGSDKASLINPSSTTPAKILSLSQDNKALHLHHALLAGNDAIAEANRHHFAHHHHTCLNLMGTPGAGKTALLEMLIQRLRQQGRGVAVLEGDQHTSNDARRIQAAGGQALQINTGTGCHLDAEMIRAGAESLHLPDGSLLIIENVGNLVCPALFDLGESAKIAMMAVTDGDDKPVKYPHMFSHCELVIVNKVDLLPYVDFDMDKVRHDLSHLNPGCPVLTLSAKTGEGVDAVLAWLTDRLADG